MTHDERPLKPQEALEACFYAVWGTLRDGPRGRPGEVVERYSRNPRFHEALQALRAEDIQNVRVDTFLDTSKKDKR